MRGREPLARHEGMEPLDGGKGAHDRGIRVASISPRRHERIDVALAHGIGLVYAPLAEEGQIRRKIAPIGGEGVLRQIPLDRQRGEVLPRRLFERRRRPTRLAEGGTRRRTGISLAMSKRDQNPTPRARSWA